MKLTCRRFYTVQHLLRYKTLAPFSNVNGFYMFIFYFHIVFVSYATLFLLQFISYLFWMGVSGALMHPAHSGHCTSLVLMFRVFIVQ